jgi:hypothetical protein
MVIRILIALIILLTSNYFTGNTSYQAGYQDGYTKYLYENWVPPAIGIKAMSKHPNPSLMPKSNG